MRRVLILFAHPVYERSRVNRRMVDAVDDLEGVTVHDLYTVYPTMRINVRREQALLLEHDVVVFQHPFYWYSTPAIMKEWQDLVLEHGWAYGAGGTKLRGKLTFNVITTGGPATAYKREGYNRYTVKELLAPYDQTAHLCGMRYLPPFAVHAALKVVGDADVAEAKVRYRRLIEAVRDDRFDLDRAESSENLCDDIDALIGAREVA
jgi:glutathione-regulated potassium-efflux system ancillary protein KefG